MTMASIVLVGRLRLRGLLRARWRTAARLALIAVAVGPVVALADVSYQLRLGDLPFADPSTLTAVGSVYAKGSGATNFNLTFSDLARVQQDVTALVGGAGVQSLSFVDRADVFDLKGQDFTLRARGARVSPGYFDLVGAAPAAGRVFNAESYRAGDQRAVVLSDSLWNDQFGRAAAAIGAPLVLGGQAYTVIGAMPPAFRGTDLEPADLWIPWVAAAAEVKAPGQVCCTIIARLAPGVSPRDAGARLSQGLANKRLVAVPIREQLSQKPLEALGLLSISAGLVILLAIVALIHSHLAGATASSRDMAILRTHGAPAATLWLGLIVEDWLLSLAAIPLSAAGAAAVFALVSPLMLDGRSGVDVTFAAASIVLVSVLLSAVVSAVAAVVAATRVARADNIAALTHRHADAARPRHERAGSLVVASVLTALLVVSSVVASGVLRLSASHLGFKPGGLSVVDMRLSFDRYKTAADVAQFEAATADAIRRVPGVESVSITGAVPIAAPGRTRVFKNRRSGERVEMTEYRVDSQFFRELRIPIVEGRGFEATEPQPVAVVSRRCAASLEDGHPLQAQLDLTVPTRVVGVAGDIVSRAANWDSCALFVPANQEKTWVVRLLVRSSLAGGAADRSFRRAVASAVADQPVDRVVSLQSVIDEAIAPRRIIAASVGGLAVVAWLVAVIWFQGTLLTAVADRRREIGLRMALGGAAWRVGGRILWAELRPMIFGTAVGVAFSLATARAVRHVLPVLDAPVISIAIWLAVFGLGLIGASCLPIVIRAVSRPPRALLY